MNRIYQGKVTAVEIADGKDWKPFDADPKQAKAKWQSALWQHHQLFQDAVNYYIVALAALASSPDGKLTRLRSLLEMVWDGFEKKGQRRQGMRDSLQRAWQLAEPPTLAAAVERFRQPLLKNGVQADEMELAGESLAVDLGGEGSIQQGGIEYWPYFCQSGFKRGVTFPREAAQLAKEKAVKQIARLVWHFGAEAHVGHILRALKQSQFCNVSGGGKNLTQDRAKEVFHDALETLENAGHITTKQKESFSAKLEALVPEVAEYAGGSINKDALKERFYGFLVFKNLAPDMEGLRVLQSIYDEPTKRQTGKKKEPTDKERQEARLVSLGDDPIKMVRARSRIVFRAFTALPLWQCESISTDLHERSAYIHELEAGETQQVAWKEFDVAAFKEALKVYNQFLQNVDNREEKLNGFAAKLLLMDCECAMDAYASDADRALRGRLEKVWKESKGKPKAPMNDSGEESSIPRFAGDARIDRLRQIINDDLAEEYRLTEGRRTPYGLRRRTMKGWGDVKRHWQGIVKKGESYSEAKRQKLQSVLDEMRGGEKREQIGSHKLFEALIADEAAWSIWREPDDKLQEQINKHEWAADPLETFREYCEIREAMEEVSTRPLNFTPADPHYSRRLFMFTDVCSFGKDGGDYKHDPQELAVTVPVAIRGTAGQFSVKRCRLVYSAPRLLRDQIRAEDGGYTQDWIQPMMRALFGSGPDAANPQELKDAAVQLMPDYDTKGEQRFLLNFPLWLKPTHCWQKVYKARGQEEVFAIRYSKKDKKKEKPLNGGIWESNVRTFWEADSPKKRDFLYWPDDERKKQDWSKGDWWEKLACFRVLAADLGTRHSASIAIMDCTREKSGTARFIGSAGGMEWFACYRCGAILRLPGENARALRLESPLDKDALGKAFREELYGKRGRPADETECDETFTMMTALCPPVATGDLDQESLPHGGLLGGITDTPMLKQHFSFPELNDKLLVAVRRAQRWIADCISWHWKLTQPDNEDQRAAALNKLREQERKPEWKVLADGSEENLAKLRQSLHAEIKNQRLGVQEELLKLTRRILPLRGRIWEWVAHPDKPDCHLLRQTDEGTGPDKVKLRGQRGLSMARIEQLSELRRRWQSLNQSLRREIGQKPLTASEMRNDPIPDPCPEILTKLENIREQRVNQTAHLILAQALGLQLRKPHLSSKTRAITDMHGEYEVARPPVDIIVLEDLSRYLSEQGRAKSENTRLMKWCHRAITQKAKMLAEPFGIPVLETPAAYSSRFCSLTGVAGFRASEVGWEDRNEFRWRELLNADLQALDKELQETGENKGKKDTLQRRYAEIKGAKDMFGELEKISHSDQHHRTLLAPQPGGPMFVTVKEIAHPAPATNRKQEGNGSVLPMQADLNAAANLALRAVAHSACASIHHRLRTERKKGIVLTREPRRFGTEKVAIIPEKENSLPKERNTNLFFDEHGIADFGRARLESDNESSFAYASGPGLWKKVNDRVRQWERCRSINARRLAHWSVALQDNIPR